MKGEGQGERVNGCVVHSHSVFTDSHIHLHKQPHVQSCYTYPCHNVFKAPLMLHVIPHTQLRELQVMSPYKIEVALLHCN